MTDDPRGAGALTHFRSPIHPLLTLFLYKLGISGSSSPLCDDAGSLAVGQRFRKRPNEFAVTVIGHSGILPHRPAIVSGR